LAERDEILQNEGQWCIATLVRRALAEVCTVPVLLVMVALCNRADHYIFIIRPHRSTTYVDAAYCYRPSSVVCPSVCRSVCHT